MVAAYMTDNAEPHGGLGAYFLLPENAKEVWRMQAFAAASSAADDASFASWLLGMGLISASGYQSLKER